MATYSAASSAPAQTSKWAGSRFERCLEGLIEGMQKDLPIHALARLQYNEQGWKFIAIPSDPAHGNFARGDTSNAACANAVTVVLTLLCIFWRHSRLH